MARSTRRNYNQFW